MKVIKVSALRARGLRPVGRVAEPPGVGLAPQTTNEKKTDTMKKEILPDPQTVEPQISPCPLRPEPALTARCSVRPVAGNTGFQGGKIEAQPRLYTFAEFSVRVDDDFDPFTRN